MQAQTRALVVAAIDFGTTYSGWAFSFYSDFRGDPTKVSSKHWSSGKLVSLKCPTTVLIQPDGATLDCFGYEAENKYIDLEDKENWYFFHRFKMMLFNTKNLSRDTLLKDEGGKTLPAITVFSLSIRFLKDDFLREMNKQKVDLNLGINDMGIVLTVPAIWNDAAKQFMREAAIEAGIADNKLIIALEPEAASCYCRHLSVRQIEEGDDLAMGTLPEGSKYIVLDAGGGSVDVTVHEVLKDGHLKEKHAASGGAWGGTKVDDAFVQFLEAILGKELMKELRDTYPEDFIDTMREFEIRKREVKPGNSQSVTIKLPICALQEIIEERGYPTVRDALNSSLYSANVSVKREKLIIDSNTFKSLYSETRESIINHIKELFEQPEIADCFGILMVGGFSESLLLQEEIKSAFPEKKVIIPQEPGLAILKGAVIFGHEPESISQRISRFTYGTDTTRLFNEAIHPEEKKVLYDGEPRCKDLFSTLIRAGECIKVGEIKRCGTFTPVTKSQTKIGFHFYITKDKDPDYVTDDGCTPVGSLDIDIPVDPDSDRGVEVSVIFGGTEIKVVCSNKDTGEIKHHYINFLG